MALTLLQLAFYFGLLSVVAFGGVPSVMPEMQRIVVEVKEWTSAAEFLQLFAIAQAAPGPNILIVSLIGWKTAGLAGAVVALAAACGPAAVITWWVADLWDRFKDSPWRAAIQRAIAPVVVALVLSGGYVIATPGGTPNWRLWLIAAASATVVLATKRNPLWSIGLGAVMGALLLS